MSQDINFASCASFFPFSSPAFDATFASQLRAWHTGLQSPITGTCAGIDYGDGVARGYVTVDTVSQCTVSNPSSSGYFAPGGGASPRTRTCCSATG